MTQQGPLPKLSTFGDSELRFLRPSKSMVKKVKQSIIGDNVFAYLKQERGIGYQQSKLRINIHSYIGGKKISS